MELLFRRKAFHATEDEFNKMTFLNSPKDYGLFTIFDKKIVFESDDHNVLELPIQNIKTWKVVSEPTYWWYIVLLSILPILTIISFIKNFLIIQALSVENVVLLPLALIIPALIVYVILYKRMWIYLAFNNATFSGYFSFDWRAGYFRLPWSRQEDALMWFINRGDCKQVYNLITKLKNGE